MNRLVQSRALHVFLAVLLQFALLPSQGLMRCAESSTGAHSCCCATSDDGSAVAPVHAPESQSCCSLAVATAPAPSQLPSQAPSRASTGGGAGAGEPCQCIDTPHRPAFPVDSKTHSNEDQNDLSASLSATPYALIDGWSESELTVRRILPRARTGPPLYVLYQIYLI